MTTKTERPDIETYLKSTQAGRGYDTSCIIELCQYTHKLETIMQSIPHADGCGIHGSLGSRFYFRLPDENCNCWRSEHRELLSSILGK